jgi:6-phosphogluconolactonase (cycloisomerase 2 family)
MKKLLGIVVLVLLYSKAFAAPTFVDSFSVNSEETRVNGFTFNNDGTKMFVAGHNGDDINEYTLSTAWDVSTAEFVDSFDTESEDDDTRDVKFNQNGRKMFVLGKENDRVCEYKLSTGFDVSTATFVDCASVSEEGSPDELEFNPDGTKMFVMGESGDDVNEYTLSTGFDVSTATFVDSFSVRSEDNVPMGLAFTYDGTKMFVTGWQNDTVIEYTLSTGFDVSTATFVDSYAIPNSVENEPSSLAFSSDGTKMFILGREDNEVHEYTLSCYYGVVNCSDPTTLKEVLGSIESQTATARQIVQHVTTPVLNRMDWLRRHRKEDSLTNQNIKFNFSNEMLASLSKVMPVAAKVNKASNLSDKWSFWSEGSISVGRVGDTESSSSKDINSNGITVGIDKKINENKLYGYALRLGKDDVDVGAFTSLDTNSYSLSAYGTFPHDDTKFVEGILGISALKTDHITQGGGTNRTGERNGRQVFGSINYLTTFNKDKFNITPNARLDLGYTELSEYSETGTSALIYDKQKIETGMISAGFTLTDIIEFNTITIKPSGGLELGLDFSPSSAATVSYVSDPNTNYTSFIGQDSKNIRANLGFDLIVENGFSLIAIYERNQSDNSHSNTLYLGAGYIPSEDIEYAMSLDDDDKVFFNYKRNINGFDITFGSNYSLMSEIPEYGANLKISSKF